MSFKQSQELSLVSQELSFHVMLDFAQFKVFPLQNMLMSFICLFPSKDGWTEVKKFSDENFGWFEESIRHRTPTPHPVN